MLVLTQLCGQSITVGGDRARAGTECGGPATHHPSGARNLVCRHITLRAGLLLHDFRTPDEVGYTTFLATAAYGLFLGHTDSSTALQTVLGHHYCLHRGRYSFLQLCSLRFTR